MKVLSALRSPILWIALVLPAGLWAQTSPFIKSFGAAHIAVGGSTSLSFTLNNTYDFQLTGVGFNDTMPAGLVVATPNGLTGSCGGGTITATAGSGSLSLTGATLPVSASCTFSVNVTGTTPGFKINITSQFIADQYVGGPVGTASLTVDPPNPPTIGKSFGAAHIAVGGSTSLSFSVTNSYSFPLTGVAVTDTLPAGLVIATPTGLTGTCGSGTPSATAGSGSVSLSAGTLAAGASCTFSVNVTATTSGTKNNTTGTISSTEGGTGLTASASLTVDPIGPPTIGKAFGAAHIAVGASTNLTFTITNPNPSTGLTGIAVSDNLPAGLVISTPNGATNTCGGSVTAVAASGTASLSGGSLAAAGSCTFSVNVTATASGTKNNTTGTISSTEGGTGLTASASLTVDPIGPPTISKAFGVTRFTVGGITSLSFTITNPNPSTGLSGVAFTDTLPAGMVISSPNGLTGACGSGTITATAGSGVASLTGGTLAAAGSCTFSVNVTATTVGTMSNTTGAVSSTEGGTGSTASASVVAQPPPTIPVLSPVALAGLALLLAGLGWVLASRQGQRSRPNV